MWVLSMDAAGIPAITPDADKMLLEHPRAWSVACCWLKGASQKPGCCRLENTRLATTWIITKVLPQHMAQERGAFKVLCDATW
jgi:hypothetical protein